MYRLPKRSNYFKSGDFKSTCQEDPSPCVIISDIHLIHSQTSRLYVVSGEGQIKKT